MDWQATIAAELERARQARQAGNEGQARVCARRAAGAAVREHLRRQGRAPHTPSAYDLLRDLADRPDLPAEVSAAAAALTLRVTEEFELPVSTDLIAQARQLIRALLPDWQE